MAVVGIDLGTTNSVVALENEQGRQIVLNQAGERQTRSVVGLHPKSGETLVGTQAVDNAGRNPENAIFSIKRLMGRFYDDPNIEKARSRSRYRIVKPEDGDDVRVMLGDEMLRPQDVAAMILRRMREDATDRLGEEVTHAVITVPAYFSLSQKAATREAGEIAGLRVKTLVTEPTAAAMAFGVESDLEEMANVLVYDLGGGTFDVTVISIVGAYFNELAIEGDMWLGGDDFDQVIVDYVVQQVEEEYRVDNLRDNGRFMVLLNKAAEKAKTQISEMQSTAIVLEAAVPLPDGDRGDVDVEITRSYFESMIRDDIEKTMVLVRKALDEAAMTADQLDHVLLVGGSTAIPLVKATLEAEFGAERIMRNIDPMECVAFGAGIAARRIPGIICPEDQEENPEDATTCWKCGTKLLPEKKCPQCQATNPIEAQECAECGYGFEQIHAGTVLGKPVGLLAAGGDYRVVAPKGIPYPTAESVAVRLQTAEDSDVAVLVPLYDAQVEEFDPDDPQQWLGAAHIALEGSFLAAGTPVDITIDIDRNGCLSIRARIQDGTGRSQSVWIDISQPRSKEGPVLEVDNGNGEEEDGERLPEWHGRLLWSVVEAEIALEDYDWFLSSSAEREIGDLVKQGRQAIDDNDESNGRRLEKEIDDLLEKEFKGLIFLLHTEMRCRYGDMEAGTKNRIQSLVRELRQNLRSNGSPDEFSRMVDELVELLKQSKAEAPMEKADKGTLLK